MLSKFLIRFGLMFNFYVVDEPDRCVSLQMLSADIGLLQIYRYLCMFSNMSWSYPSFLRLGKSLDNLF